jgi:hypothetical protein
MSHKSKSGEAGREAITMPEGFFWHGGCRFDRQAALLFNRILRWMTH